MLEEAEEKVRRLRAEMEATPKPAAIVRTLPGLVERYAKDLRATLGKDTDRARELLRGLLGTITLKPEKEGVFAEVRGSLAIVLSLEDVSYNWCRGRESNPHGACAPTAFEAVMSSDSITPARHP